MFALRILPLKAESSSHQVTIVFFDPDRSWASQGALLRLFLPNLK